MTSKKVLRTTFAAVSAATLTILATPGIALADEEPAAAQTSATDYNNRGLAGVATPPDQETQSRIPDEGKLAIHKKSPTTAEGEDRPKADGSAVPDSKLPGSENIEGVTFEVYLVKGVDLKTNEGWKLANDLVEKWNEKSAADKNDAEELMDSSGKPYKLELKKTLTTNAQGLAVEEGESEAPTLPAGLYVVKEKIKSNAVVKVGGVRVKNNSEIIQAAPFVVAVPLTDPGNTKEWLKTVNVYPKNSQSGITKKVQDSETPGLGNEGDHADQSTATYTINANIPTGFAPPKSQETEEEAKKNKNRLTNFEILDRFSDSVNYWVDGKHTQTLKMVSGDGTETALEPADYVITGSDNLPNPVVTNGVDHYSRVLVSFTDVGLKKLVDFAKKHGNNPQVQWEFQARFDDVTQKDIPNDAWVIPNHPNGWDVTTDNEPDTPKVTVTSKYGRVEILKTNNKNADEEGYKGLEGAEFQLFECDKDANKLNWKTHTDENPQPIVVGGVETFKTNGQGEVVIDGLHLNNFRNQTSANEDAALITNPDDIGYYCLEEIKAPVVDGVKYEKLPEMIQFQLLTTTPNVTKKLTIKNVPGNGGFDLPLTGGKGVWPLIGLGGLLVAGSAGYAAWASRRKTAQA